MKGQQVFYLLIQAVLLYETLAWEVRMPTEIHGLKGSCLVIPCSYSYTSNPPTNPRRVVWYQWVSRGYPLVCDPLNPDSVIDKFRGKTDLYNPTNSDWDCSLLIKSVDLSHNGERLHTWIDPENIGWRTYEFYDVTSTIIVDTNPQQPIINISGGLKIGDSITVACYTYHTCPYSKPNIILNGIEGSDVIDDVLMENGQWKTTRTRTGVVKAEHSNIECTVTHHGGITARATKCVLPCETLAWEVKMPTEIHGLKGSCLVIPCSYSYTSNPPTNPRRVTWYQWVSRGYPLVYDPLNPDSVIDKFRGKTDIYRHNNSDQDCSLLIKSVNSSHNGEKLYTWIDPENIGWRTYKFFDVTSTIIVDSNPQHPIINISGGLKTGDSITVACYTYHTCPYSKPNIILKGIEGSDKIDDVDIKHGQWKITLTRTGVVKAEHSNIECTVTHHGGITTRATKSQSAKCVYSSITIEPKQAADIIEGVDMNFTCTVHHSCQTNPPILSWNYENMSVNYDTKQLTGFEWATFSTIKFLGEKKDDGKKLICTTNISGQKITASVDLHEQHSSKPVTPVQSKSVSQNEPDVMTFDLKTIGLYSLAFSFALLLICIFAGVIIYKKCNRSNELYASSADETESDEIFKPGNHHQREAAILFTLQYMTSNG
ncbi:uncharacterized protein [Paramisgurnus dabryanus]|uniref:uncharacterized protein isoform X2 n=1 Tax=Paramisgurnus dabryanus TaxID=90735 RepID=UPI003CCF70BA